MSFFKKARRLRISGGEFVSIGRDQLNFHAYHLTDPLHRLWEAIKDVGASYNSEIRYPQPKCHPNTRQEVLQLLREWVHSSSSDRVFWLYGPAGAGKSAIAQTVAEAAQQEEFLASSFFFSRADPWRDGPTYLFLSIAYELVHSIPELSNPIGEAIRENPALLRASLEEQFQKLIVDPCNSLDKAIFRRLLIVIDGLDECSGSQAQQRILSILATILSFDIPFRFLICSRPEPPIREAFNTHGFRPFLRRIALDETFKPGRDIQVFLIDEFKHISQNPRNSHILFPDPWPAIGIIDEIVQKACGQFIYAATVIKFLNDEYKAPFRDLDILYHQILSANTQQSKLQDILVAIIALLRTSIFYTEEAGPSAIEALLLLTKGSVISTLRGLHSLFEIGDPETQILPLHASFVEFLSGSSRSGPFFVGTENGQYAAIACWLLRSLNHYFDVSQGNIMSLPKFQRRVFSAAWVDWGYYCAKCNFEGDVLSTLEGVDFTKILGSFITSYLDNVFGVPESWLPAFFKNSEVLLLHLETRADDYNDLKRRFLGWRKGFRVKLPRAGTLAIRLLEAAASNLAWAVFPYDEGRTHSDNLQSLQRKRPTFFKPSHFQIIALGDDCSFSCTRHDLQAAAIPCAASDNVYHVRITVAVRELVCFTMQKVRWWKLKPTGRLAYNGKFPVLCTLLEDCGPCIEFLSLLPPLIAKIQSKMDHDGISKWLQASLHRCFRGDVY
uniref:NACHT domain-containing protein n=1 Tax=Moniliophthora roreri TaxID=221103 RepID=A0A0W0FVY1_MONRR